MDAQTGLAENGHTGSWRERLLEAGAFVQESEGERRAAPVLEGLGERVRWGVRVAPDIRVDALLESLWLVIEYDGREAHERALRQAADAARAVRIRALGCEVLRIRHLDPFEVRDRLQNSAEPAAWSLNPALGFLDHTHRQGPGMVQVDEAIAAAQSASPGQIAVGDGSDPVTTITVTNTGEAEVTYALGHEPAATGWSTFAPGFPVGFDEESGEFFLLPATVDVPDQVTVPAGGQETLDVTVTPPFGRFDVLPNHQFGGYLTMTSDEVSDLRVPYVGFDGDYQQMPLLGYVADDGSIVEQEPFLAEIVDVDDDGVLITEPVEEGHEFTVRDGDYPVIEAFFGHFPQAMEVHAVHRPSGNEHLVFTAEHLPRSPGPEDFLAFAWPGTTQAGQSDNVRAVPSGRYHLEVNVLRPRRS